MQFIWQPYQKHANQLTKFVHDSDSALFSSCTSLIAYWIVEGHNTDRCMKQFGLKQIVPVPFNKPFRRYDQQQCTGVDFSVKFKEARSLWNERARHILASDADTYNGCHSEEYFKWYGRITRRRISRPDSDDASSISLKPRLVQPELPFGPSMSTMEPARHETKGEPRSVNTLI